TAVLVLHCCPCQVGLRCGTSRFRWLWPRTSGGLPGPQACRAGSDYGPMAIVQRLVAQLPVRLGVGKSTHIFKVARRETFHVRESGSQVLRQPVDYFAAPAFVRLTFKDVPPDFPVKQRQLLSSAKV